MIHTSRTFRITDHSIFPSTTLRAGSDLKAGGAALPEKVFPRLCALAPAHGFLFQAVDLRWEYAGSSSSLIQKDARHV